MYIYTYIYLYIYIYIYIKRCKSINKKINMESNTVTFRASANVFHIIIT